MLGKAYSVSGRWVSLDPNRTPTQDHNLTWSRLPPKSNGAKCQNLDSDFGENRPKLFFGNPANKQTNTDENKISLAEVKTKLKLSR